MNDEQISALVDDALPAGETAGAVDELLSEAPARATWSRYHLIGDALRDSARLQGPTAAPLTRPDNVISFPTAAPPAAAPLAPPRRRSTAVGLAAAAAIAAFAFSFSVLAPQGAREHGTNLADRASPPPVTVAPTPVNVAASGPEVVVIDGEGNEVQQVSQNIMVQSDEAQQRMNDYLANFNERRARQPMPGVHPYVRIVGYETR